MLNNLLGQLHYIPQAIIIAVMLIMSCLFVKEHKDKTIYILRECFIGHYKIVAFLSYTALLITGTVLGRPLSNPFTNLLGYFGLFYSELHLINYIGIENILLFIPYTFLYIVAFKPAEKVRKCFLLSVMTTLFIELFQLLFWVGQFAFADIFHNIMGGMIGCGLWYITRYIYRKIRKSSN